VERSTTPANSNQYGHVAWICERRKTAIRPTDPTPAPTADPTDGPTQEPISSPVGPLRVLPSPDAAAPEAVWYRPPYIRQTRNVARCPDAYVPITDTRTCGEASAYLRIENEPEYDGDWDPGQPIVCFVTNVDAENTLDHLDWPSTTRVNSYCFISAAWICQLQTEAERTGQPSARTGRPSARTGRPSASMSDPDDVLRDQQTRPPYIHRRTSRPISGQAALDRLFGPSLPDYVRQKRGVDACPDRYSPITDAAACAAASAALHIENTPQFDGDWSPGDPLVCFVTNVDGNERLHNVPWPSTSRVSSNHWPDDAWICRLEQGEGGTAVAPAPSLSFLVQVSIPPVRLLGFLTLVLLLILLLSVYWFWFRHHNSKLQT